MPRIDTGRAPMTQPGRTEIPEELIPFLDALAELLAENHERHKLIDTVRSPQRPDIVRGRISRGWPETDDVSD